MRVPTRDKEEEKGERGSSEGVEEMREKKGQVRWRSSRE